MKTVLKLGLFSNLLLMSVFYSVKANAFDKYDGEYAGKKRGEAVCQAIWMGNAKTKTEAFEKSLNYIEYQSTLEDINMVVSLLSKYGAEHPIVDAFTTRSANTIFDTCNAEYYALP